MRPSAWRSAAPSSTRRSDPCRALAARRYRRAGLGQGADGATGLLPPQISSMRMMHNGEVSSAACRRTTRSKVSLLTGSLSLPGRSRSRGRATDRPRRCRDDRTIASSRDVRRADRPATVSPSRSAKMWRRQPGSGQRNRRRDAHLNGATVRGQVQEPPLIAAVHLLGLPPAIRTRASGGATPGR